MSKYLKVINQAYKLLGKRDAVLLPWLPYVVLSGRSDSNSEFSDSTEYCVGPWWQGMTHPWTWILRSGRGQTHMVGERSPRSGLHPHPHHAPGASEDSQGSGGHPQEADLGRKAPHGSWKQFEAVLAGNSGVLGSLKHGLEGGVRMHVSPWPFRTPCPVEHRALGPGPKSGSDLH